MKHCLLVIVFLFLTVVPHQQAISRKVSSGSGASGCLTGSYISLPTSGFPIQHLTFVNKCPYAMNIIYCEEGSFGTALSARKGLRISCDQPQALRKTHIEAKGDKYGLDIMGYNILTRKSQNDNFEMRQHVHGDYGFHTTELFTGDNIKLHFVACSVNTGPNNTTWNGSMLVADCK